MSLNRVRNAWKGARRWRHLSEEYTFSGGEGAPTGFYEHHEYGKLMGELHGLEAQHSIIGLARQNHNDAHMGVSNNRHTIGTKWDIYNDF